MFADGQGFGQGASLGPILSLVSPFPLFITIIPNSLGIDLVLSGEDSFEGREN